MPTNTKTLSETELKHTIQRFHRNKFLKIKPLFYILFAICSAMMLGDMFLNGTLDRKWEEMRQKRQHGIYIATDQEERKYKALIKKPQWRRWAEDIALRETFAGMFALSFILLATILQEFLTTFGSSSKLPDLKTTRKLIHKIFGLPTLLALSEDEDQFINDCLVRWLNTHEVNDVVAVLAWHNISAPSETDKNNFIMLIKHLRQKPQLIADIQTKQSEINFLLKEKPNLQELNALKTLLQHTAQLEEMDTTQLQAFDKELRQKLLEINRP